MPEAPKNVHQLGPALGVDSQELLEMINGRETPTKAVTHGLAKELDSDVKHLERLAERKLEKGPRLAPTGAQHIGLPAV